MVDFSRLAGVCSRAFGGRDEVVWLPAGGAAVPLTGAIVDRDPARVFDFDGTPDAADLGYEGETVAVHVPTTLVAALAEGASLTLDGVPHVVARRPKASVDGMTRLDLREA